MHHYLAFPCVHTGGMDIWESKRQFISGMLAVRVRLGPHVIDDDRVPIAMHSPYFRAGLLVVHVKLKTAGCFFYNFAEQSATTLE